jgi:hypothetical protein
MPANAVTQFLKRKLASGAPTDEIDLRLDEIDELRISLLGDEAIYERGEQR